MMMTPTAIRLPADLLVKLKQLAHFESLRTGEDVTWSGLVRTAIEKLLTEASKKGAFRVPGDAPAEAGPEFAVDPDGDASAQF